MGFRVCSGDYTLQLAAPSTEERDTWVNVTLAEIVKCVGAVGAGVDGDGDGEARVGYGLVHELLQGTLHYAALRGPSKPSCSKALYRSDRVTRD